MKLRIRLRRAMGRTALVAGSLLALWLVDRSGTPAGGQSASQLQRKHAQKSYQ